MPNVQFLTLRYRSLDDKDPGVTKKRRKSVANKSGSTKELVCFIFCVNKFTLFVTSCDEPESDAGPILHFLPSTSVCQLVLGQENQQPRGVNQYRNTSHCIMHTP